MSEISPLEAYRKTQEESAMLLDVREDEEVAGASLPGALHIPLGQLSDRAGELPETGELLPICRTGVRSAFATEMLNYNGYQASNVVGGIDAWRQAGLPVDP